MVGEIDGRVVFNTQYRKQCARNPDACLNGGTRILGQQCKEFVHRSIHKRKSTLTGSRLHAMSRAIPYSPMHVARKEVSERRMQEILDKHKPKVEVMPSESRVCPDERHDTGGTGAVAGAASAENTLHWEKISGYYMRSKCGMYRCRKYFSGDVANDQHAAFRYQLEKKVGDLWFYRLGPPFDTWPQARAAAEADAKR